MQLYPAIDLLDGRCARLLQGRFESPSFYGEPVEQALAFRSEGASWLHVVDLDGAKAGRSIQGEKIREISKKSGLSIQCGGGIRTAADIAGLLEGGVSRVVIGSKALEDPQAFTRWLAEFGKEQIVLALDLRWKGNGWQVCSHGWQEDTGKDPEAVLLPFLEAGLEHVLMTDISRDGALTGLNLSLYQDFSGNFPSLSLQASGGVNSLEDLHKVRGSVAGVIMGKALYEGHFTLSEALRAEALQVAAKEVSQPC